MGRIFESNMKENMGVTLSKYYGIVMAMNRFPENVNISIEELAESADVHWNTARKALMFFYAVSPLVPVFKIEKDQGFRLISKPKATIAINNLFLSMEMRITSKMILEKATSKTHSLGIFELKRFLEEDEISYLTILLQKGLINSVDGRFYLSTKGKIIANLAIKELTDLGITLPWEEREKAHAFSTRLRHSNVKPPHFLNFSSNWETGSFMKRMSKSKLCAIGAGV